MLKADKRKATNEKDVFCKMLYTLKEYKDKMDSFHDEMSRHTEGFVWNTDGYLIDNIINTLSHMVSDEWDSVSYWAWDMDFGRSQTSGILIDKKKIDIRTPEKLYDYLKEGKYAYI